MLIDIVFPSFDLLGESSELTYFYIYSEPDELLLPGVLIYFIDCSLSSYSSSDSLSSTSMVITYYFFGLGFYLTSLMIESL